MNHDKVDEIWLTVIVTHKSEWDNWSCCLAP